MEKNILSGVENYNVELSCERDDLIIQTHASQRFKSSDHDKSSSNNEHEASDEDSDYNSDDKLLELYHSQEKYLHID